MDQFALIDAALRYHHHVELGVPAHHLAPYREEWLARALAMVPQPQGDGPDKVRAAPAGCAGPARVARSMPGAGGRHPACIGSPCCEGRFPATAAPPSPAPGPHIQDYHDAFIEHCAGELQADYQRAMRKSALHYILLRPAEQERLALQPLRPLLALPGAWQQAAARLAARRLPASWRRNVALARDEITWTLQVRRGRAGGVGLKRVGCWLWSRAFHARCPQHAQGSACSGVCVADCCRRR